MLTEEQLQEIAGWLKTLEQRSSLAGVRIVPESIATDMRALIAEVRRLRKFEQEPVGVNQLIGL